MKQLNTLTIVDDAPIGDNIKERDWEVSLEGSSQKYRINSKAQLESYTLTVKKGVEINDETDIEKENMEARWLHMENFTELIILKDTDAQAELLIRNGLVKNTKFTKFD